jgi:hypothetical protein
VTCDLKGAAFKLLSDTEQQQDLKDLWENYSVCDIKYFLFENILI